MTARALVAATIVALLPVAAARAQASASGHPAGLRAFVSVEFPAAITVVDVGSRTIVGRVRLRGKPHNLDATSDGRRIVVTSQTTGTLQVVDGRRLRVLQTVAGLRSPHDVKLTPDGRFTYVTEEGGSTIAAVDVERGRVVQRIEVGQRPHDLAGGDVLWVTRAGDRLTVVGCGHPTGRGCQSGPGRLSVLARPEVGGPAHDIDRFPDTAGAWLTYWGSPRVGVVTQATRLVGRPRAVTGAMHLAVDVSTGQRVWVVGENGDAAILDRRGRVLRRVRIGGSLHHVAIAPAAGLVGVVRGSPDALVLLPGSGGLAAAVPLGGRGHDVGFAIVATGPRPS